MDTGPRRQGIHFQLSLTNGQRGVWVHGKGIGLGLESQILGGGGMLSAQEGWL
jgi:hypothetical protein